MINLLPPHEKGQLRAARTNRLLLRYNFLVIIAFVFLIGSLGVVFAFLKNTEAAAEETIAYNQSKVGDYTSVQAEAENFKQRLSSAKQILDTDVAYTNVIMQIAEVMPRGVVLDTLSLDSKTFGSPTTLAAKVKDYPTALNLKNALQKSNVFSNVSIQSITGGGDGDYPLSVTLNVTIRKDAAS